MSADAIAIRRSVTAARRIAPAGDFDNVAEYCIAKHVSSGMVKTILFDMVTEAKAPQPGVAVFHRAPLAAVFGAGRRCI